MKDWETLKHLLEEVQSHQEICCFSCDNRNDMGFVGKIKSFELSHDLFDKDKEICELVLVGNEVSHYVYPRDYIRKDFFVLIIKDTKIKIQVDEIDCCPPDNFINNKCNRIRLSCFIRDVDFLFEEKPIEVFNPILTRWEILDI